MKVSQRQVVLALLLILTIGALLAIIYQLIVPSTTMGLASTILGLLILGSLLGAYWQGWSHARYAMLIVITLLIGLSTEGIFLTSSFSMTAFLPAVLALIVAGPTWVVGCSMGVLLMLIVRSGGHGIYTDPLAILLYVLFVSGVVLARLVTNTAQLESEESAEKARQALARSEAQAHELAQKAHELEAQNAQQRRLLDLVNTLETPAVSLAEGVLLAPVVGHLDSRRASDLTKRLLDEVSTQRARMVILDIAGVPTVDTAVAQSILRAIQAVRLLGCEVTVTGISASVAATMTQLGINMGGVKTARTPQEVMSGDMFGGPRPMNN